MVGRRLTFSQHQTKMMPLEDIGALFADSEGTEDEDGRTKVGQTSLINNSEKNNNPVQIEKTEA